jgi:hypothetical protein
MLSLTRQVFTPEGPKEETRSFEEVYQELSQNDLSFRILLLLIELIVEEFNQNRTWHGRPIITRDQVIQQLKSKMQIAK